MFERFTDRARRMIVDSNEAAQKLNHNFIGNEHLLIALAGEEGGIAASVLGSFGITADDIRAKCNKGDKSPRNPPPFTPGFKQTLEFALREALGMGHNYIGPEHLLLGWTRFAGNHPDDWMTEKMLELRANVGLQAIRRAVVMEIPDAGETNRSISISVSQKLFEEFDQHIRKQELPEDHVLSRLHNLMSASFDASF